MPATETAQAPAENGELIKDMRQEQIDSLIKTRGYKAYTGMLEQQIRDDIKKNEKSSLKIRIELDLEVEVHLTARVKGDVTIGLL
ncbi:hypothetical protein Tdes44962_MAKER04442 [Teratosphaeria destructans]|uniref:Uncharacterized protein n=1 Tax=Teratosphaeria destructans TaxID=418781 RepID=A0A9W7VZY4_9PEZI|nr:hypothetical protein Tdes44962_MAKER04442 [Teratosphaeria destructans]